MKHARGKMTPEEPGLFRAIAEFTYDWESWIDPAGTTAWINPAVERMTGYSVEECLRMRTYPLAIVAEIDRKRMRTALEGARRGTSGNDVEFRAVRKDGTQRWLAMSWQPLVFRGKRRGYRTSVRDIDDRKKTEEALFDAKQRAEAADRAKSEFLAVMSHEIRSPLQVVNGYAQLLALTPLTALQSSYVEPMKRENEALLRIVGDILDFSSLQSGRLQLDDVVFDLRDVIDGVVEAMRPRALAKGLTLHVASTRTLPPALRGDPHRVRQVLLNVVDNAVKFTASGGITIEVRRTSPVRGGPVLLTMSVTDTGIGIPRSRRGRLFEMFSQADTSTSRRYGGSGLGLAICRRLCERMGGTITVEDTPRGKGARFTITLPFRIPARTELPPPAAAAGAIDERFSARLPLEILVVDDSAVARDVAVALLAALGYRADSAATGRGAITRSKRRRYDLVLLDMHMPGLDGLETARQLRANAKRVVALTADVFVRGTDSLDAVLTKPLELRALATFLTKLADDVLLDLASRADSQGRPLLATLAPRFEKDGQRLLRAIASSSARGDTKRFGEATHELKGLALSFGARELARQCEDLKLDAAKDRVAALKRLFDDAMVAIRRHI